MENYIVSDGVREHHIRSDGPLPAWALAAGVSSTRRTVKRATRRSGPNYDGTYNSVIAAYRYEQVRPTCGAKVLVHYLDHQRRWIPGRELIDQFGTEALRRSRELRESAGWPVIERPAGKGVTWEYCMDLSAIQKVRVIKRRRRYS